MHALLEDGEVRCRNVFVSGTAYSFVSADKH